MPKLPVRRLDRAEKEFLARACREGLLTIERIREALAYDARRPSRKPFVFVLVELGYLDLEAIDRLVAEVAGPTWELIDDLVFHRRYEEAIQALTRRIETGEDRARALHFRGRMLAMLGRHGEAIADFERALEAGPEQPRMMFDLGSSHLARRSFPEAVRAFDRALAIDPGCVDALNNRAIALAMSGDPVAAQESWRIAIRSDRRRRTAQHNLAHLLRVCARHAA